MNDRFPRLLFLVAFLGAHGLLPAEELSARQVMDRALHIDGGRSVDAQTAITVLEEGRTVRQRKMRFRRAVERGLDRVRIDFTAPADLKGMALLILDRPGGGTDQHLYTPSLRRVRRIRGSLKSEEFADTDFSYEDMERRDPDDAEHSFDGEETLDGRACRKILSATRKKVRSQYARSVTWVDKESFVARRMELYDRRGDLFKTLTVPRVEKIDGTWTQMRMEMRNLRKNRLTVYEVLDLKYGAELDPNIFTPTALGQ